LGGLLFAGALQWKGLRGALRAVDLLRWPTLGALVAALVVSFALGMLFWSGALPLLAADAEMDARPPPGHFAQLAARGFSRVLLVRPAAPAGRAAGGGGGGGGRLGARGGGWGGRRRARRARGRRGARARLRGGPGRVGGGERGGERKERGRGGKRLRGVGENN